MKMSVLERAIYIAGGVLIVLAAVKVVWSSFQFVMKYLEKGED